VYESTFLSMFDVQMNTISNVDKNVLSYTEDGLKESRNVCKYK